MIITIYQININNDVLNINDNICNILTTYIFIVRCNLRLSGGLFDAERTYDFAASCDTLVFIRQLCTCNCY